MFVIVPVLGFYCEGIASPRAYPLGLACARRFESHEFVCCCPIAGAARAGSGGGLSVSVSAGIDPHVLVVGSVHGSFCTAVRASLP